MYYASDKVSGFNGLNQDIMVFFRYQDVPEEMTVELEHLVLKSHVFKGTTSTILRLLEKHNIPHMTLHEGRFWRFLGVSDAGNILIEEVTL